MIPRVRRTPFRSNQLIANNTGVIHRLAAKVDDEISSTLIACRNWFKVRQKQLRDERSRRPHIGLALANTPEIFGLVESESKCVAVEVPGALIGQDGGLN